jgi:elongation factor 1-alpha
MADKKDKTHVSIVICGHVDAGKSTTTGRLIFELGGISERDLAKLKAEADALGKGSFAFAFYMDKSKEERARGVTIACTTKEFYTDRYHYTVIDAPGHRDFIKNMISGASQADVALLMVPADGNFVTAIQKGNHKEGLVQGQTRQHALLINQLGVKQIMVGVNKMDTDTAGPYSEARFKEIKDESEAMLMKVGWKKDQVKKQTPFIPMSGWKGDNLLAASTNMSWYKGNKVTNLAGEKVEVTTLLTGLNNFACPPPRYPDKNLRVPISSLYNIKGVGNVLAGRVEQGVVTPGLEVLFIPTHTDAVPCKGKVFSIEMHKKSVEEAGTGDNVGMCIKGLEKTNMPHGGDVMVDKNDKSLKPVARFTAQVRTFQIPGELKTGYFPIGFVRCGYSACSVREIKWKMGKETNGQKVEGPTGIKANEMAEIVFEPMQPLVVEPFSACEGLSRVSFMDGNTAVMLGKIVAVDYK